MTEDNGSEERLGRVPGQMDNLALPAPETKKFKVSGIIPPTTPEERKQMEEDIARSYMPPSKDEVKRLELIIKQKNMIIATLRNRIEKDEEFFREIMRLL